MFISPKIHLLESELEARMKEVMLEVQEMCEFLGHYDIADTVTFYNTIWNLQYASEEDDRIEYEEAMWDAYYDTMLSLRFNP